MSAGDILDFLELYSLLLPKGYTPGVASLERAEGGEDVWHQAFNLLRAVREREAKYMFCAFISLEYI